MRRHGQRSQKIWPGGKWPQVMPGLSLDEDWHGNWDCNWYRGCGKRGFWDGEDVEVGGRQRVRVNYV